MVEREARQLRVVHLRSMSALGDGLGPGQFVEDAVVTSRVRSRRDGGGFGERTEFDAMFNTLSSGLGRRIRPNVSYGEPGSMRTVSVRSWDCSSNHRAIMAAIGLGG